jgi:hypothetical protein
VPHFLPSPPRESVRKVGPAGYNILVACKTAERSRYAEMGFTIGPRQTKTVVELNTAGLGVYSSDGQYRA